MFLNFILLFHVSTFQRHTIPPLFEFLAQDSVTRHTVHLDLIYSRLATPQAFFFFYTNNLHGLLYHQSTTIIYGSINPSVYMYYSWIWQQC